MLIIDYIEGLWHKFAVFKDLFRIAYYNWESEHLTRTKNNLTKWELLKDEDDERLKCLQERV